MKTFSKCLVGLVSVLFLFTAYSSAPVSRDATPPAAKFIEVCSNGTVYVPPETRFVTCYGRIMRVIAIVPMGAQVQSNPDCNCPRCCDGACAVTVSCGNGGGLCTAYLGC